MFRSSTPSKAARRSGHNFAKMQLSVTKTDPRDAVLLAEYGRLVEPPVYQMSTDSLLRLRQKRTLLRQYQKQRTILLNLQHSFAPLPVKDTSTEQSLLTMIEAFDTAMASLHQEVCQICQEDFKVQYDRLTSIKGISHKVATALIETTIRTFVPLKPSLSLLAWLQPLINRVKWPLIEAFAERATLIYEAYCMLPVGLLFAITSPAGNSIAAAHRQRLKAAGKASKLALIAVANKLLRQAFALVRFGEDYNENYQPKFRSTACI